jgi:hypothetical protein
MISCLYFLPELGYGIGTTESGIPAAAGILALSHTWNLAQGCPQGRVQTITAKPTTSLFSWACEVVVKKASYAAAASG